MRLQSDGASAGALRVLNLSLCICMSSPVCMASPCGFSSQSPQQVVGCGSSRFIKV